MDCRPRRSPPHTLRVDQGLDLLAPVDLHQVLLESRRRQLAELSPVGPEVDAHHATGEVAQTEHGAGGEVGELEVRGGVPLVERSGRAGRDRGRGGEAEKEEGKDPADPVVAMYGMNGYEPRRGSGHPDAGR